MNDHDKQALRAMLQASLRERGDSGVFADEDSLFITGRLDSMAMIGLISYLEQQFGIDFADVDFDVSLVDSMQDIEAFLRDAGQR